MSTELELQQLRARVDTLEATAGELVRAMGALAAHVDGEAPRPTTVGVLEAHHIQLVERVRARELSTRRTA